MPRKHRRGRADLLHHDSARDPSRKEEPEQTTICAAIALSDSIWLSNKRKNLPKTRNLAFEMPNKRENVPETLNLVFEKPRIFLKPLSKTPSDMGPAPKGIDRNGDPLMAKVRALSGICLIPGQTQTTRHEVEPSIPRRRPPKCTAGWAEPQPPSTGAYRAARFSTGIYSTPS